MTKTRILCRLLVCGLGGLPVDAAEPAAGFEGRIVDDATGAALAARVAVTNIHGEFLETEGRHSHVEYLGKRWCYVAGSFAFEVPEDGAGLEIRRGLETLPEHWEVEPLAAGKPAARTFRLRRWVNLQRQGHVCGDIHAHQPIPAEAVGQMEAEDLGALHLLHVADPYMAPAVNEEFTGAMDAHSRPGCEVRVGQEIRDWQMGHLNLLGLTGLIPGYPDMGGTMEYWRTMPHWDLVRAMQAAREQQGTVVWAHIASLPGAQLPVATALGLVDAVELITWHDPTQLPNHWSPWLNSGMSMAEFPVLRAVDLYYQFLNAGFHLPIAAGTDKFFEEIPLGSNRTYARVEGTADYAGWLAAIKAGRCFVSNGPILEFSVEDHQPGEVVTLSGPQTVVARVRARSILPFTTLEIVLNGAVVAHKTIAIPASEPIDGLYDMQIETSLELTHSAWLAARVVDHPDLPNRILPRDVAVFAHTSPVYFLRDGREVREPASVAYLGKWVAGLLHWLESHPPFANESDRQNARQTAEQALRYYRSPEGTRAQ